MSARHKKILDVIATDSTFERKVIRGDEVWVGRCLFCRGRLQISLRGEPLSEATIEHIRPRNHGGTDELENLAIACASCNHEKGVRHDASRRPSERANQVTAELAARRLALWRDRE